MKHVLRGSHVSVADSPVIHELGCLPYKEAHATQLRCVNALIKDRNLPDSILLLEHPSVFTLGRQGKREAFKRTGDEIKRMGADIIHTERGGDVTYHGPGQLVAYPIVDLRRKKISVSDFIYSLEEIMVLTCRDFGVSVVRDERNRGVWVDNSKIGSVGIRIRHGVSFHGLALNVTLSLEPFSWIQPCGLSGVGVTSLAKESAEPIDLENVKIKMKSYIQKLLA